MAEVVDLSATLQMLKAVSPLRRVLLGATGTLQGTLSAYWSAPVTIRLIAQEDGFYRILRREVDLVCLDRRIVACGAVTHMRVTDAAMATLLRESTLGIGQIITLLGRSSSFALEIVGQDEEQFWRTYRIWGEGFDFQIRETFEKDLYPDLEELTLPASDGPAPVPAAGNPADQGTVRRADR